MRIMQRPRVEVVGPRRGHIEQGRDVRLAALNFAAQQYGGQRGFGLVTHHLDILGVQTGQLDCLLHGILDKADLVDQAVLPGLLGREDLAGGHTVQSVRVFGKIGAPLLDHVLEPLETLVHQALENLYFLFGHGLRHAPHVLQWFTEDGVFAEPTTWTGSIGVVIPHYDLSDMLGNWGVIEDSILSEPLKNMGSMAKRMTEEEKEVFEGLVDESFQRFKDVIKQGRPKFAENPDALDSLATGQIFTAQQAQQNGLVDKIGFIEEAVGRAIELAGLNAKDVKVVRYKPEPTRPPYCWAATFKAAHRTSRPCSI